MRNAIVFSSILATLLAPLTGAATEGVVYGGSSTLAETVLQGGAIRAFENKTGIKFTVADVSGTGKGIKALADGKLNLVGAGRTLEPAEKKSGLLGTIVGYDGLAVYVNKANGVKSLTKTQLKEIFTGKVKSWKEVGGADVPVVPMIEPVASKRATVALFQELVLDGAPYAGVREMEQLHDQLAEASRNKGGIAIASIGFLPSVDPGVRAGLRAVSLDGTDASAGNIRSGAYLLSRPMLLVTKGLPSGDVKAFVDYLVSNDGQAIVEKFFVKVKK